MKKIAIPMAAALALSACSEHEQTADASYAPDSVAEEVSADAAGAAENVEAQSEIADRAELPANMPKLAYEYGFTYRLPSSDMSSLMRRHANLCDQQGPQSCQILGMDLTGSAERDNQRGTLTLAVAANHARAVSALLEDEATEAGAEQVSANISSDELSKQMVDTEARIEARTQLRDRLMETLKTRRGTVKELVEAERSVAQVNEEIDQARSWLKEMEGRVSFSRVTLNYQSGVAPASDFLGPVQGALGSVGSILGMMFATLIMLATILIPLGLLGYGAIAVKRRLARNDAPAAEA